MRKMTNPTRKVIILVMQTWRYDGTIDIVNKMNISIGEYHGKTY